LTGDEVLALFTRTGAYLEGHFRLTSGLHSDRYLQSALTLQHPREAERLGAALGERLRGCGAQVVVGPALGAIVLAHEVARALGARAIFAERGPDRAMALRRGFTVAPGEGAVVVENVVTTGGSVREVIEVLRAARARVLAVAALADRSGGGEPPFDVPFHYLLRLELRTYEPAACPLCAAGVPMEKPGSRPA
jgi:orotate phosphoribosyltransferase